MFIIDFILGAYPLYRASRDAGMGLYDSVPLVNWINAFLQSKGL